MNKPIYYGLTDKAQAIAYAQAVCDVLGHGVNGCAVQLLVETAAAETLLGQFRDPSPYSAGTGLTQVDFGTFRWLQHKYQNHAKGKAILNAFGIYLERVSYQELEISPLLSFIFCRLRYCVVPSSIPDTQSKRAKYWKRFYNSSMGKGTAIEYLMRCKQVGVKELFEEYLKKLTGEAA